MQSLFPRLRQLILPFYALPNDAAMILGPDLPPCMQSRYAAAQFFRPPNTVGRGLSSPTWRFVAQRLSSSVVEEGWLIWDQVSVCGFVVDRRRIGGTNLAGQISSLEQVTPLFAGGAASYNGLSGGFTWQILGTAAQPAAFQIGQIGTGPALTTFQVDGVHQGRGIVAHVESTVNSAAVGAETVVLTTPTFTVFDNRAYKWKLLGHLVGSVAGANANAQIRLVNLAGISMGFVSVPTAAAGPFYSYAFEGYFRRIGAGSDLVGTNLVQTLLTTAGTVTAAGGTNAVRSLEVYDVGSAFDYTSAIQV